MLTVNVVPHRVGQSRDRREDCGTHHQQRCRFHNKGEGQGRGAKLPSMGASTKTAFNGTIKRHLVKQRRLGGARCLTGVHEEAAQQLPGGRRILQATSPLAVARACDDAVHDVYSYHLGPIYMAQPLLRANGSAGGGRGGGGMEGITTNMRGGGEGRGGPTP